MKPAGRPLFQHRQEKMMAWAKVVAVELGNSFGSGHFFESRTD